MTLPPRYRWLIAVPVMLVGLGLILATCGVIEFARPVSRRSALWDGPFHWQIAVFGLMFLCAGVNPIVPERWQRTRLVLGMIIFIAFVVGLIGIAIEAGTRP